MRRRHPRPTARRAPLALVAVLLMTGACGGRDRKDATVTGRVMSLDDKAYCVSPDRGETQTCVDIPDPRAVQGVDVGECVTTTKDLTSEDSFVKVVDDAECAAGDLGESNDGGGD